MPLFAEFDMTQLPFGFDNWLLNLLCAMTIATLAAFFVKTLKGNPPMDQQVRDLERRLTEKIDTEVDTTSDWVRDNFVQRVEFTGLIAKLDEREKHANDHRAALGITIQQLFELLRAIDGKLNFMEGRQSKTQRITIENKQP